MLFVAALAVCCASALAAGGYHGNPREVVFPGPISSRSNGGAAAAAPDNQLVRSLELAKQINRVQSVEEFYKLINVIPSELSYSVGSVTDRFGGAERSNAIVAKQAVCMPELQVVPVLENPDPAAVYYPSCVRIKRCGGCCNHELLSCQPTATEIRNYEIHVTKIEEDLGQYNAFKEIVPLEEHTACKCHCKVKEKDCSEKQYYSEHECRCICKNLDEEDKCRQQNEKKYWNASSCSCQCRKVEECSTGFFFDQNLCSCKPLPISRHWFSDERRTGYNFRQPTGKPKETPPVIVTLDASDPRRKHKEDPEYK
ncbi:vascular endothelial growth factor C isoform X1 [Nasonia vitripennis]|uniref:Platelet-derived growth factor (PDGF) family profile domain-containing protein n=1 Tax=Nasonia vitripennis TaxID=7425 RepID=A0A7M7IQN8_NASVI|nr:vascular endothelial growth factor C isoform X1 [Nasonia vitripennis]